LAHRYLRGQGLVVVARNYRPPEGQGEIDLVCWEGETLVFVEVKTRSTDEFGPPDRAVDSAKREALLRAARYYARRAGVEWESVRFDVVDVVVGEPTRIEHIRDAFAARPRAPLPAG
jgi:putative endonuclease